jgi:hypothetical protein
MHDVDCTSQICAYFDVSGGTGDETWRIFNTKLTADLFGDGKIILQPQHF